MGRTTSSRDYLIARYVEILETVDIGSAPLADLTALIAILPSTDFGHQFFVRKGAHGSVNF